MDHDERQPHRRDQSRARRASKRAQDHVTREVFFGEKENRDAGSPSKRVTLGPAAPAQPLAPTTERTSERPRESGREMEDRIARHLCEMVHVFQNWHEMKSNVRLAALMAVDRGIAMHQRRPQLSGIGSYVERPASRGMYWPRENRVDLNRAVLRRRSPRMAIRAYLHEVRHAYQFDVMEKPNAHPEVSAARVLLWKAAAMLYPKMSDNPTYLQMLAYELSPLEIDAQAFVNRIYRRIKKEMHHVLQNVV